MKRSYLEWTHVAGFVKPGTVETRMTFESGGPFDLCSSREDLVVVHVPPAFLHEPI
jgi:hypothetical protein